MERERKDNSQYLVHVQEAARVTDMKNLFAHKAEMCLHHLNQIVAATANKNPFSISLSLLSQSISTLNIGKSVIASLSLTVNLAGISF